MKKKYFPFDDPEYVRLFKTYATGGLDKLWRQYRMGYHYTNAQSLLNIIENNELWLTQADFLNDNQEIVYAHKKIMDEIKRSKYDNFVVESIEKRIEHDKKK